MTRVLVVEDEGLVAKDIKCTLEDLGYEVPATAQSGEDAIRVAASLRPDIVLMDIRLKGAMDGIQAAGIFRRGLRIPVIFLTAHSDEATLQRAKLAAPFGYLVKPFEANDLRVAIEVAIHKHAADLAIERHEELLATVLGSLEEAVVGVDTQGRVTFMNARAERLTGVAEADALRKPASDVLDVTFPDASRLELRLGDAADGDGRAGSVRRGGVIRSRATREAVIVDARVTPMFDRSGRAEGAVLVLHDRSAAAEVERLTLETTRLRAEISRRVSELV